MAERTADVEFLQQQGIYIILRVSPLFVHFRSSNARVFAIFLTHSAEVECSAQSVPVQNPASFLTTPTGRHHMNSTQYVLCKFNH